MSPSTGLEGPYALSVAAIDRVVTETKPGVYVLERSTSPESFIVNYVGRSDSDVHERLKDWVGKNRYKRFKFSYMSSPKAAFEKECTIYHDFEHLDNEIHPQRPAESDWKCPRCYLFG